MCKPFFQCLSCGKYDNAAKSIFKTHENCTCNKIKINMAPNCEKCRNAPPNQQYVNMTDLSRGNNLPQSSTSFSIFEKKNFPIPEYPKFHKSLIIRNADDETEYEKLCASLRQHRANGIFYCQEKTNCKHTATCLTDMTEHIWSKERRKLVRCESCDNTFPALIRSFKSHMTFKHQDYEFEEKTDAYVFCGMPVSQN